MLVLVAWSHPLEVQNKAEQELSQIIHNTEKCLQRNQHSTVNKSKGITYFLFKEGAQGRLNRE